MLSKTFTANMDTVPQMMETVEEICAGLPEQAAFDITLCCEELLVNIADYAYPEGDGELIIHWQNDTDNRRITLIFEDSGIPFNPLACDEPNLKVPLGERKIGGLGIMMVRDRMDDVRYAYDNGKNRLTLEKRY